MNSICFIANKYPNEIDKNGLVFVQQLVWAIADLGIKCYVICPCAANLNPKFFKLKEHQVEVTDKGSKINVYFPKFFGLGQSHYIFGKSPAPITTYFFTKSVIRTIKKYQLDLDAVYGHFAAPAGVCAARVGRLLDIPSFMAHGESTSWSIDQFGQDRMKQEFDSLSGVIAVSSRNRDLLLEKGVVSKERIQVFPNGYRPERFYKMGKKEARNKLGWDEEKFIVGFVGSFDERKGPLRLQAAVEMIDDVYFACAGKGTQQPGGERCVFSGVINNAELVCFYNALDAFVLPTLNEGCCNAIIEAMACGCPIISSNLPFNDDILDASCSIRVNPNSIEDIAYAIRVLKDNDFDLDQGALRKAKMLTLEQRAKSIYKYIELVSNS